MKRLFSIVALLGSCIVLIPHARAQSAAAESLFQEGKKRMEAGDYAAACPMLLESENLDPAIGTLLALALCYERAGKTASAWTTYIEVVKRAEIEKDSERARAAAKRRAALEPKLSRLTIRVDSEAQALSGLVVQLDGRPLGENIFNVATPIDPGAHVVEATAAHHAPFRTTVQIAAGNDHKTIEVELVQDAAQPAVAPPKKQSPSSVSKLPEEPERGRNNGTPLRTAAFVSGAVGVVAIGLGSYFALDAKSKNDASGDDCDGNFCGPQGKADRNDALSASHRATAAFVVGGVLIATGVTLWVIAPSHTVSVGPTLGPSSAGLQSKARF